MRFPIAVATLVLLAPAAAHAQAYDWRPVNHQTSTMLKAGEYDAALPIIRNALASCPQAVTPREAALCIAIFSENLATEQAHQGDIPAAEASMHKLLESRLEVLPPNDPLIANAHLLISLFYQRLGRRADEAAALRAAIGIARADGPPQRPLLQDLLTRLALAHAALGQPQSALAPFQEAYTLNRDIAGPTAAATLTSLVLLFNDQIAAGRAQDGLDAVQTVLSRPDADALDPPLRARLTGLFALETTTAERSRIALKLAQVALPDLNAGLVTDPDTSFVLLRGAARVMAAFGDPARAVTLAQRARTIAAAKYGPASFAVVSALRTEAEAETASQDPSAAIDSLTQAADMLTAPNQLLARAQIQAQLAATLIAAGRPADAIKRLHATLDTPALVDAPSNIRTAVQALLGEALVGAGAFQDGRTACNTAAIGATQQSAQQSAQPSAQQSPQQPPPASDYVFMALTCTATAELGLHNPEQAFATALRAQDAIWEAAQPPPIPQQIRVTNLRARALHALNRDQEAIALYRQELALDRHLGDPASQIASQAATWSEIAALQRLSFLWTDAQASVDAGLALIGNQGFDRTRANLLNNRALVYIANARPAQAIPILETVLALRRTDAGPETAAIANNERDLALALSATGRDQEAAAHLDIAIHLFTTLGPPDRNDLIQALDHRVTIAKAAGDPPAAEAALRQLLTLNDPSSEATAVVRMTLADTLDNQAHRTEAASLRQAALQAIEARFGPASSQAMRTRLLALPMLRATGEWRQADTIGQDCLTLARTVTDLRLQCLLAQADNALTEGSIRQAGDLSAAAVTEAETRWSQNTAALTQALTLNARAQALLGHTGIVLSLFDRIRGLTLHQHNGTAWADDVEGRLLIQSNEPDIGKTFLAQALTQAKLTQDASLAVSATEALAQHAKALGLPAAELWGAILPMLSDSNPALLARAQESFAASLAAEGDYPHAAVLLSQADSLTRTTQGAASPDHLRVLLQEAEAFTRAGWPARAQAIRQDLAADPNPAVRRLATQADLQAAFAAGDPVAGLMLARIAVAQVTALCGPDSAAAAIARIDLIEARIGAGHFVNPADLATAVATLATQDPSWRTEFRAERVLGALAAHTGRLDVAAAAFTRAEALAATHEGADSLNVARQRANRAGVRLLANDVTGADTLFRQALAIAAPNGQWHNPVWASIAQQAASAAERAGDVLRAVRLRHDADTLVPPADPQTTWRWA